MGMYLVVSREGVAPEALGIYGADGTILTDCVDTRMRLFTTADAAIKHAAKNKPCAIWCVSDNESAELIVRLD